jgi:hypothetical protein
MWWWVVGREVVKVGEVGVSSGMLKTLKVRYGRGGSAGAVLGKTGDTSNAKMGLALAVGQPQPKKS